MIFRERLDALLEEYDAAVAQLQGKRRWLDGLLGLGKHPGEDPCHDQLDERVKALCDEASGEEATAGGRLELVEGILRAEGRWKGPEFARLMLCAIQRHALPLIPLLEGADRARLAEWYAKACPRYRRLPVQEQVLAALKK